MRKPRPFNHKPIYSDGRPAAGALGVRALCPSRAARRRARPGVSVPMLLSLLLIVAAVFLLALYS